MPKLKTKSGAKKRFKVTATGKSDVRPSRQTSRHDQADEEADPSASRHQRAVQDRWRQRQEVLLAERLIASTIIATSAATFAAIRTSSHL
ncbi:ribosomal protein L35 [Bradyrhizobium sp. LM2.9]